jgi:GT2 family glycosyltransferase
MEAGIMMQNVGTAAVSVVIPCHNGSRWIRQAVESVLNQTASILEIIVVDDGSTDNSAEVISTCGERVRLIQGNWHNGNAARNAGLSVATGEWIQFLDADDALDPDKIAHQLCFARDGVDAIYGGVTLEWWEGGRCAATELSNPDPLSDVIVHWLSWQLAQTGAVLWRASSLRSIGGWKDGLPCCQDNEICLRALRLGMVFVLSQDSGAIYRIWSSTSVCRKNPQELLQVKVGLIDEFLGWLKSEGRLESVHVELASATFYRIARQLALIDLPGANAFAKLRRQMGMFSSKGLGLPRSYRAVEAVFGFFAAEVVAKAFRRLKVIFG